MIEYRHKIKEELKSIQSKIKKSIQGTSSEGKETRTQINDLEQKEETRIQKNEEKLRNLWDNFKCSNIWIIGVPEGEEEKQEIENLFEKIMKENFPNLVKEIDMQVHASSESPKEVGPKEEHTKTHHN